MADDKKDIPHNLLTKETCTIDTERDHPARAQVFQQDRFAASLTSLSSSIIDGRLRAL